MFRRRAPIFILLCFIVALWSVPSPAWSAQINTSAREAIIVDFETGTVLLEKDADVPMPPASMSKIMTTYLVFERLKDGRLSLDDELLVSEKAWRMGGSKMFVEVGSRLRVEDLLRGVIVQSGNDACIVLAEAIAGTEEAFAELMTQRARELGMSSSTFANATGWPDPNHWMTARELAILAKHVITDFPEYYHYYSETEFTWNDIRQSNRNPLLYLSLGADGLKTGHTEEAGYGLTASAERNGRRVLMVVNGLESQKARSEESARLIDWAFREFDNYALFTPGEVVEQGEVWLGDKPTVPLVIPEGLKITLARRARADMKVTVSYDSVIPAPVEEGQEVARLTVSAPDTEPVVVPLVAGESVGQLGVVGRVAAAVKYLLFGAN